MCLLFIPLFIQFVYPGIAILLLIAIGIAIKKLKEKLAGETICLVGPAHSGKTTFLEWLRTGKYVSDTHRTMPQERRVDVKIDPIRTETGTISIRTVIDTPGQLTEYDGGTIYRQEIERNDNIVFFFSISEYLQNEKYREDNMFPRLKALEKRLKDASFSPVKRLIFIGTHLDEIKKKTNNEISIEVMSLIQNKSYSYLFSEFVLLLCDLREKRDYAEILSKLSQS